MFRPVKVEKVPAKVIPSVVYPASEALSAAGFSMADGVLHGDLPNDVARDYVRDVLRQEGLEAHTIGDDAVFTTKDLRRSRAPLLVLFGETDEMWSMSSGETVLPYVGQAIAEGYSVALLSGSIKRCRFLWENIVGQCAAHEIFFAASGPSGEAAVDLLLWKPFIIAARVRGMCFYDSTHQFNPMTLESPDILSIRRLLQERSLNFIPAELPLGAQLGFSLQTQCRHLSAPSPLAARALSFEWFQAVYRALEAEESARVDQMMGLGASGQQALPGFRAVGVVERLTRLSRDRNRDDISRIISGTTA